MKTALLLLVFIAMQAFAVTRVKDISDVLTAPTMTVQGYGLVIGLEGTGDGSRTVFTQQTLASYLDRLGIRVDPNYVRVKNVAAVMVSAKVAPFARAGQRLDVSLSSLGDARSLAGGTLLATPLQGPDGEVYGNAQGSVTTGGYSVEQDGQRQTLNPSVVGRIENGMALTRALEFDFTTDSAVFVLKSPDYSTAKKIAEKLSTASFAQSNGVVVQAVDPSTVVMRLPDSLRTIAGWMNTVATAELLEVDTDVAARVVINERTGTVVVGSNVRILPVAIAHGPLTVKVKQTPLVSQPNEFGQGNTVQTTQTELDVAQAGTGMQVIEQTASVGDVAAALNRLGATPRDIVAIFQALKAAGALQAELVIL
ncbi:MAG: flagellar basal body P-ring protein FlgI [bacterium]|nr:flagellar basal body P-ring protein FlgI [bacterium]